MSYPPQNPYGQQPYGQQPYGQQPPPGYSQQQYEQSHQATQAGMPLPPQAPPYQAAPAGQFGAPLFQPPGGEGPQVWDAGTLPANDNVNPYCFSVDLNGAYYLQKGKMIAYYGEMRFSGVGRGALDQLLERNFNSPLHASDWVVAEGRGKLLLADRAYDLNSYDLEDGNLTVRSGNLLAFEPTLQLKQSIIPGFLTLIGTGKFVAASNGPVHFVEPPVRVDPQALVGWADCPAPCHHYDHGYLHGVLGGLRHLTGIGGASGEEHQFEFIGAGQVLMQSSETLMADRSVGVIGAEPGIPGAHVPHQQQQHGGGVPGLGNLGDLGRRFGL
ncbi:AIM24 family protein [Kitasatospora phosalacinea]|uniref:AIM24 family protein n=1 Tax=Kitasatospora phosalacinea TaxID=2065 RepID=UPI0035DC3338